MAKTFQDFVRQKLEDYEPKSTLAKIGKYGVTEELLEELRKQYPNGCKGNSLYAQAVNDLLKPN